MKYLFLLAVLLPAVFCAPQERFLFGNLQIHLPGKEDVVKVVEGFAHSGMGQSACVAACGTACAATAVLAPLAFACPNVCSEVLKRVK